MKINWKVLETVLDNYYFCHNPGGDEQLFHLTDDAHLGFGIDYDKDEISFFNYYDCDFFSDKSYDEIDKDAKYWKYEIPKTFKELLNLAFKTETLYYDDELGTIEEVTTDLISKYNTLVFENANIKTRKRETIVIDEEIDYTASEFIYEGKSYVKIKDTLVDNDIEYYDVIVKRKIDYKYFKYSWMIDKMGNHSLETNLEEVFSKRVVTTIYI